MRTNRIALFLIAGFVAITGSRKLGIAKDSSVAEQWERERVSNVEFLIANNTRIILGPGHARLISVLLEPAGFTIENIRTILEYLSRKYPTEDTLTIDCFSGEEELRGRLSWFADIESFPFGNLLPARCGSGLASPPLSASYWRTNGMESINFYDATGNSIYVDLVVLSKDCTPSGDMPVDLIVASRMGCVDVV